MRIPKIKSFKSKSKAERYEIKSKHVATAFDVVLNNNVYRQINPELPEIVEGQEIECKDVPYGYFVYKGLVWPVYDDDPGQQSCIYLKGEWYGAGAYTMWPYDVKYFIEVINDVYKFL